LFWGARSREDLYSDDTLRQWATEYASFEYTPVLSEPRESDDWHGATGWVHDEVIRRQPKLNDFEVYAAGPPAMIDAIKRDFPAQGLVVERLYFDSFEHATDL
jgi:CDP-4-dehydro-6-deoxyglucose reductase